MKRPMTLDEIVRCQIFWIDDFGRITARVHALEVANPVTDKTAVRIHVEEIEPGVGQGAVDMCDENGKVSAWLTSSGLCAPTVCEGDLP
jgi:hypothetical protein